MPNNTEISIYVRDEDGATVFSCSCGEYDKGQIILAAAERHNNVKHGGTYTIIDNRPYSL